MALERFQGITINNDPLISIFLIFLTQTIIIIVTLTKWTELKLQSDNTHVSLINDNFSKKYIKLHQNVVPGTLFLILLRTFLIVDHQSLLFLQLILLLRISICKFTSYKQHRSSSLYWTIFSTFCKAFIIYNTGNQYFSDTDDPKYFFEFITIVTACGNITFEDRCYQVDEMMLERKIEAEKLRKKQKLKKEKEKEKDKDAKKEERRRERERPTERSWLDHPPVNFIRSLTLAILNFSRHIWMFLVAITVFLFILFFDGFLVAKLGLLNIKETQVLFNVVKNVHSPMVSVPVDKVFQYSKKLHVPGYTQNMSKPRMSQLVDFKLKDFEALKFTKSDSKVITCSSCQLEYKLLTSGSTPPSKKYDKYFHRYNSDHAISCLSLPNCNKGNFKYRSEYEKIFPQKSIGFYEKKAYHYLEKNDDKLNNEMRALNIFTDVEYFDFHKNVTIYPRFEASVLLIKHVLKQKNKNLQASFVKSATAPPPPVATPLDPKSHSPVEDRHLTYFKLIEKTKNKFETIKNIVSNLQNRNEQIRFEPFLETTDFLKGFLMWSKSDYDAAREIFNENYTSLKIYNVELEKLWFDLEYVLWQSKIKEKYGIYPSKYKKLLSGEVKSCMALIWPDDKKLSDQQKVWKLVALISINLQEAEKNEAEKYARLVIKLTEDYNVLEFACMAMDCSEVDFKNLPISNVYPEHLLKFQPKSKKTRRTNDSNENDESNDENVNLQSDRDGDLNDQSNDTSNNSVTDGKLDAESQPIKTQDEEMLEKVKLFFEMSEIKSTGKEVLSTLDFIKRQNAEELRLASLEYLDELLEKYE